MSRTLFMSLFHKSSLLETFPRIELSYEKKTHKKVRSSSFCLTIPRGPKYFAWFRQSQGVPMCFLLCVNIYKKEITKVSIVTACFDSVVCAGLGTIIYGTFFQVSSLSFFNIEDIFYFKGQNLIRYNYLTRLQSTERLCRHYLRQAVLTQNDVIFGTPLVDVSTDLLRKRAEQLPYSLYCIQHHWVGRNRSALNEILEEAALTPLNFRVSAQLAPDIYSLHSSEGFHAYACIPDYQTSVLMNGIFRNIKENENLDSLEESEDEEEFEDISPSKFVDLQKSCLMRCVYIGRFGGWKPEKLAETGHICAANDIAHIKKK